MIQVVCAIPLCFEGFTNFLITVLPKTVHRLTNLKDKTGSCSPVTLSSRPVCDMSDVHQPL